jgi:hypothetical protein
MGHSQSQAVGVFAAMVARLQGGVIDEADSAFWDEFWKTTLTAEVGVDSATVFMCCVLCTAVVVCTC